MSGGHFEYEQYHIGNIAEQIKDAIIRNESKEQTEWGPVSYGFSDDTIAEFKTAVILLEQAQIYAQRIDWLISGDDGEDTFHERLQTELNGLKFT